MAFPLHPDTPEEGRSLEQLFAGRGVDIPQLISHLKRTAARLDLPFGDRTMTYNSRLAQELSKWAESEGKGEAFHRAAFEAYFVRGLNIAKSDVLAGIARSAGLSFEAALEAAAARTFKKDVDRDWQRSYQQGVTAVPTFMCQGRTLVGAQPYEQLRKLAVGSS